jgi:hypothetical protein
MNSRDAEPNLRTGPAHGLEHPLFRDQANNETESGEIRESWKMDMAYGYFGGAYSLVNHAEADLYGANLLDNGARTFFNAMDFGMAKQAEGDYVGVAQASTVMALALLEMNYWWIWNEDIVGETHSAGVVPYSSQQMPRSTSVHAAQGFLHTEETNFFKYQIRDRLIELYPPPG